MNNEINKLCLIYELKGRQELYASMYLNILDRMAKMTKIQSTKANYRILNNRLKGLMEESIVPKNTNEKEVMGYSLALEYIMSDYDNIPFNKDTLIKLHNMIFSYNDLEIKNIEDIFKYYEFSIKGENNPLIYIPEILFRFIKAEAFKDGNARIARLIILLLLFKNGFFIGKYISISYLIEENKEEYKKSIKKSDSKEFINFFLDLIYKAYDIVNNKFLDIAKDNLSSSEKVLRQIIKQIKPVSKEDIIQLCPDISQRTIERALKNLQENNKIKKVGVGKTTKYILRGDNKDEN
ncbi:Fic family protein [Oceanivirga miroungae]|uniref:Fido domain-containing protein n=1 Tax=Oceanivirga miroungae TaxID=1130046 RepID=A0A6I8MFH2_9FUSO|nr:Fic family protein [Oceanivirga miroungae]VWL85870.1 hypothetical protein OMES3154_01155 [Oceanivirga miroungae]